MNFPNLNILSVLLNPDSAALLLYASCAFFVAPVVTRLCGELNHRIVGLSNNTIVVLKSFRLSVD